MLEIIILLLVLIAVYWYYETRRPKNYPPGPKWLPFVGNTPLLRKTAIQLNGQHLAFEKWMNDYNSPVIGLKLGNLYFVIVLPYPLIRAVYTREEFEGRPDNFFFRLRTMGTRLGITSVDGPLWVEHRNFAVRHLREAGFGRSAMDLQIHSELMEMVKVIGDYKERPLWPGEFLASHVINVLWRFAAGSRIEGKRLTHLLVLMSERAKAFDMAGGVMNQLPWLRFIAPEKTGFNLINRLNKDLYDLFMGSIIEHKKTYSDDKSSDDLIYSYIKEQLAQQSNPNSTFTDIQLVMIISDMFIAGSGTTSTTLDLALMMMVLRPEIQAKIHSELDGEIKNGVPPNLNEREHFPYTNAVIMEIHRYFHIAPLGGPRRVMKTTSLAGYTIPKNTTVLLGLGYVHMDEEYWTDPKVFRPERFLDDQMNIINSERLITFAIGKRKCLGDALARSCLFTFFAGILQNFQLLPAESEPKPSMKLIPGMILTPKPYKIVFKRRFKQ